MSFWLKDYAKLLEKMEYLQFKLTDPYLTLDEKKETKDEIGHCRTRKQHFEELVSKFNSIEQKILFEKYVQGKTLEQLAMDLNFSPSYIKKVHANTMRIIKMLED